MTKAKVTFPSAPDTSAIDIKDEGSLIVSNPTAMNFTGPGVTVTENPTGTAEVDIPGLQYWTESEASAVQQTAAFTPKTTATDSNAALVAKGTGATTAQIPDGTIAGGNARGEYATDFQKIRNNATQVASGNGSGIFAGRRNSATGPYSVVVTGETNTASGQGSFVGGGDSNSASGFGSAILIGASSTASGKRSAIAGSSCISSGVNSIALNASSRGIGDYSLGGGYFSRAYLRGMESRASGFWLSSSGNTVDEAAAQTTKTVAFRRFEATTGQTFNLSMDGTGSTNLYILLGNNRASNLTAQFVLSVIGINGTATGVTAGDFMTQTITFGAKRVGGTCTVTTATILSTAGDASITGTATITFTAGGWNEIVITVTAPTFAGGGSLILGAACTFTTTEVNSSI